MARPEEPIPVAERLFRGVEPSWIEGDRVLPAAVDKQGTSVNREKYASPESVLTPKRTRIATVCQQDFPEPMTLNNVAWEYIAVDNPLDATAVHPANDAHVEIRFHKVGVESRDADWPGPTFREILRAKLADRMRLL